MRLRGLKISIVIGVLSSTTLLAFQNCGKGFEVLGSDSNSDYMRWSAAQATISEKGTFALTGKPGKFSAAPVGDFKIEKTSGIDAGVTFACQFDAAAEIVCGTEFASPALTDGSHTLKIFLKRDGKVADSLTYGWSSDTVPPVIAASTLPTRTALRSVNIPFSVTDITSGYSKAECQIDGGRWAACPQVLTGEALAEGARTAKIRAFDKAGNSATMDIAWTIDLSSPSVTIANPPPAASNVTTYAFTFSTSGMNTAGSTTECSLDGAAFAKCTSPLRLANLPQGNRSFRVQAKNDAGVAGAVVTANWKVDTVAPTTVIGGINAALNNNNVNLTFTSADGAGGSGISSTTCLLNGVAVACANSGASILDLIHGNHNLTVSVRDGAGNVTNTVASWNSAFQIKDLSRNTFRIACSPATNMSYNSNFTGTTLQVVWTYHDAGCGAANMQELTTFSVVDYVFTKLNVNSTDITWTYTNIQYIIRPLSAARAAYLNSIGFCGLPDWSPGVPRGFANSTACSPTALVTTYWRARLDDDPDFADRYRLLSANTATGRGDTRATRPASVDTNPQNFRRALRTAGDRQEVIF